MHKEGTIVLSLSVFYLFNKFQIFANKQTYANSVFKPGSSFHEINQLKKNKKNVKITLFTTKVKFTLIPIPCFSDWLLKVTHVTGKNTQKPKASINGAFKIQLYFYFVK